MGYMCMLGIFSAYPITPRSALRLNLLQRLLWQGFRVLSAAYLQRQENNQACQACHAPEDEHIPKVIVVG